MGIFIMRMGTKIKGVLDPKQDKQGEWNFYYENGEAKRKNHL